MEMYLADSNSHVKHGKRTHCGDDSIFPDYLLDLQDLNSATKSTPAS